MEDIYIINNTQLIVKNGSLKSRAEELINKQYTDNYRFFLVEYNFELTKIISKTNKELVLCFLNKISGESYTIMYSFYDYYEVKNNLYLHLKNYSFNNFIDTFEYKLISIHNIESYHNSDFIKKTFENSGYIYSLERKEDYHIAYFVESATLEIKSLIILREFQFEKYLNKWCMCLLHDIKDKKELEGN